MRYEPWYSRWNGWIVSVLFHAAIIALLVWPEQFVALPLASGGGGAGPAGGGGGGADGGGNQERLHYIALTPVKAAQGDEQENTPQPPPTPPKPAETPPETPFETPSVAVVPPVVPPTEKPLPEVTVPVQRPSAPGTGEGAGTGQSGGGSGAGSAGTTGTGPGSGGGIGSGEGTGRGSSVGPGTGGGDGKNYPPTPKQFFLPPLPAPKSVSGFTLTAWFDVDSVGQAKLIRFTPSPDRGYNRRLREILLAMKFRPAVGPDGRPMRDTVDVQFTF